MARLSQVLVCVLVGFVATSASAASVAPASIDAEPERMSITVVLPKLQAIYEDTKTLLIRNGELKAKILEGEKKAPNAQHPNPAQQPQLARPPAGSIGGSPAQASRSRGIDYEELKEFNKWVDSNLEYARMNTLASTEALKEEAEANNGSIIYSEQAIKDGIEGVKYWRSAIIFQDKTLNNEKFDLEEVDAKDKAVNPIN